MKKLKHYLLKLKAKKSNMKYVNATTVKVLIFFIWLTLNLYKLQVEEPCKVDYHYHIDCDTLQFAVFTND